MPLDVAPNASFEGGFDLVLIESVEARSAPGRIASLLRNMNDDDDGVRRLHDLERATVRCERPLPVQVDGELLGEFDVIELGVVRDAARLLVRASARLGRRLDCAGDSCATAGAQSAGDERVALSPLGDFLDVPRDQQADRRGRQLGDRGEHDRRQPLPSRMRAEYVEPGVADEHRGGRGRGALHPEPASQQADAGRDQERSKRDVEAAPGEVVVAGLQVPAWQRQNQVRGPGQEAEPCEEEESGASQRRRRGTTGGAAPSSGSVSISAGIAC